MKVEFFTAKPGEVLKDQHSIGAKLSGSGLNSKSFWEPIPENASKEEIRKTKLRALKALVDVQLADPINQ